MTAAHVLFVVVETGARWPIWLSDMQRVVPDVVVVAADRDNTPAELALRVLHRLQGLEAEGSHVEFAAVLAGTSGATDEVFEARCLVARAVLRHMATTGTGKLAFSAPSNLADSARHELMALVGTLTDQLVGTRMSISIRFGDSRQSQQMRAPPGKAGIGRVA
jgi:hypothetical protein